MRKIILGLFIILFCFSLGAAKLQEEELSKEEMAALEKAVKILYKQREIAREIIYLYEEIEKLEREYKELEKEQCQLVDWDDLFLRAGKKTKRYNFDFLDGIKKLSLEEKKNVYYFMFEDSAAKYKPSWFDKYRTNQNKSFRVSSSERSDERYLKRIEEENDRLEDLLDEISNERFNLEQEMMMHRWEIEDAKSDLEWHMLELSSRLEFDLLFNPLLSLPFDYRYTYPGYSKKMDPINYEALLFTLSTDSKGKMDWTKYGWLKLLLNNK